MLSFWKYSTFKNINNFLPSFKKYNCVFLSWLFFCFCFVDCSVHRLVTNYRYQFLFQEMLLLSTFENHMFYLFSYNMFYKLIQFCWIFVDFFIFLKKSYIASSQNKSFENKSVIDFWSISRICFLTPFLIAFICFSIWSSIAFVYFFKVFPKEKYINLACSIIWLWSDGNISSPVRYSYLSIHLMIMLIFLQLPW